MREYKKGGYAIIDLASTTIYKDGLDAVASNKPVVVYDGTGKPYFADTISIVSDNVVITKGGKTITIANDNTITSVGDIQEHLYAISWDGNDLTIITESVTIEERFTILTNKEYSKISELPIGNYQVVNGQDNQYPLLELVVDENSRYFYNNNDDQILFTIGSDSEPYSSIKVF